MKNKILITFISVLLLSSKLAYAESASTLDSQIKQIQTDWAISKYKSLTKDEKIAGYRDCAKKSEALSNNYKNAAEPLIWQGICLSSEAELTKLSALGKVKTAKKIFERAAEINEKSLDGSAYTNLAVLHHRVPGWPIGFGNNKVAEAYFKKVLSISPNNIDANYYYALFLEDVKDNDELALHHLNIALKAPGRNRPLADAERRKEILSKIKEFQE